MTKPSLADLNSSAPVARRRSFHATVNAMGVSRSSLDLALHGLAQELRVRMFDRKTRGVAPTEAGQQFVQRPVPMLHDLDHLLATVRGTDGPVGQLRINTNESAVPWLLRHLVRGFLRRHPHETLDLVSEGRSVDIAAEGFDAGVRLREAVLQGHGDRARWRRHALSGRGGPRSSGRTRRTDDAG